MHDLALHLRTFALFSMFLHLVTLALLSFSTAVGAAASLNYQNEAYRSEQRPR